MNYLLNDTEIAGIVHVKDEDLGSVGDIMEGEKTIMKIQELLDAGKIEFWTRLKQVSIPADNCIYCIRLAPYYAVKDLKTKYI